MTAALRRRRSAGVVVVAAIVMVAVACGGSDDSASTTAGHRTTATSTATDGSTVPADCPTGAAAAPQRLVPEITRTIPHDPTAFTEGLVMLDGVLYESTGLEGRSTVRSVDPSTGSVGTEVPLDPNVFGEGLAVGAGGDLVQLTWKDGKAYVRRPTDLEAVGGFDYQGEGWGLTTLDDGTLVMSDGSNRLTERDPDDFRVVQRWTVRRSDGPVDQLNELDWDGTHIWANRWQTDEIVRIDPRCHRVDGVVDASSLVAAATSASKGAKIDVLNGIAHLPDTDRYLVTGKLWPVMFDVRFVPA